MRSYSIRPLPVTCRNADQSPAQVIRPASDQVKFMTDDWSRGKDIFPWRELGLGLGLGNVDPDLHS